jgi:hypothetical protein
VQPPYPPQGYPQVHQPYPPQQGYPAPPPQQPTQPLAPGSLDDYYNQPSAASGPSISWSNADRTPKPIGTAYAGIVARDVTNADVQQQTDFNTKAPLFYRDGRPKFAMRVPLKVQPSQEFPEGEATWYVKGQARDELVRAMTEAGASGAPQAGAGILVTLVGRRNSGAGLNPANVVQVRYSPPPGHQPAQQQPPVPTSGQQQGTDTPSPVPVQQVPQPQVQQVQQPPVQPPPVQQPPVVLAPQVQQPVPAPQVQPSPPSDLSPEQQALLARLTGG